LDKENHLEKVGVIVGTTTVAKILINVDRSAIRHNPLQRGEFILLQYPTIKQSVLAVITELGLSNLLIPETLVRDPQDMEKINLIGGLEEGEQIFAEAKIIGYMGDSGKIIAPRHPPVPGSYVYKASKEVLEPLFTQDNGIKIGTLLAHSEVPVSTDLGEIVRRHLAILAITGGGKGNTVAILAKGILSLGGSMIIIDPHEEYPQTRNVFGDEKVLVFASEADSIKRYRPIRFKISNLDAEELASLFELPRGATKQYSILKSAVKTLKTAGGNWDFNDLKNAIIEIQEGKKEFSTSAEGLLARMDKITDTLIFDPEIETPLHDPDNPCLVRPNQLTIVNVSSLSLGTQQLIVQRLLKRIFRGGIAWRRSFLGEKIPAPVLIVVEEAHNFAPAKGDAYSLSTLKKIAAEGRKFGVGLCIVSQRPGKVHPDILSQCNSMIILKIVNPFDQQNLEQSAEALSKDLFENLPGLNVGEAVVIGPAIKIPAVIKIDKFEGKLGGDDIDIINMWKKANKEEEKNQSKKTEIPNFMADDSELFG